MMLMMVYMQDINRGVMKACKCAPDAFVQMGIQVCPSPPSSRSPDNRPLYKIYASIRTILATGDKEDAGGQNPAFGPGCH
jgi:hypothetical protein